MEEKKTKEAPKKLLDHNASWPLTILYLGFLVGIYFAQNYSFKFITRDMNNYAYYFVAILGGVAFTFLFYNLGKILFARIVSISLVSSRSPYVSLLLMTIQKRTLFSFS